MEIPNHMLLWQKHLRDTERKTAQMKLLKNIELKEGVEVNSGNLILDLNGYRLQSLRKILLKSGCFS